MSHRFLLNTGSFIPAVGLGTWQAKKGEVGRAVRTALDSGYKHIDCALVYQNEAEIGEVFAEYFHGPNPKLKREEIFVTSKLWNTDHQPAEVVKGVEKTLKDLRLEYLDLYLMHWPVAFKKGPNGPVKDETGRIVLDGITINETWKAMEGLLRANKVKAIGVSNFNVTRLKHLLETAEIKPAVNQVELHPYLIQNNLFDFCNQNNIHLSAYSPLGSGLQPSLLEDPLIIELAKKYNKTPAQILISWGVQRGTSVLPKSVNAERIALNLATFELKKEDFDAVSGLNRNHRFIDTTKFFGVNVFKEEGEEGFSKL